MNTQLQNRFQEYKDKKNAYDIALNTLYFDIATGAPKDGIPYRNKMISILAGEAFSHETAKENIAMIEELSKCSDIDETEKREIALLLRDLEDIRVLPKKLYVQFTQDKADSQHAWEEAKRKNDYQLFKAHLINLIKEQKELLTYVKKDCSDYDYMLDRYQLGFNMEVYDRFFDTIKKELLPFIQHLVHDGKQIDNHVLCKPFPIKKQQAFMKILIQHLQCNDRQCSITTSEHPFTQFFSAKEARITTHFYEENVMSAVFSTIHEYGHANYGLHVNPAFEGTTLGNDIGYAMHESQSRFMENHIGRSAAFWKPLFPKFKEIFADEIKGIDFASFMRMINISQPSLIRTEADELTYPIHILIRYELEKQIFHGEIDYEQLDTLWNDKYEEYLGIRPTSDREGILQDMHWGDANFGYFPTYALGSAFAAQFYHKMAEELDVDAILEKGEFSKIYTWLSTHIHQYGAYKTADEIMQETTGEAFDVSYYITYLKEKYTDLYELKK